MCAITNLKSVLWPLAVATLLATGVGQVQAQESTPADYASTDTFSQLELRAERSEVLFSNGAKVTAIRENGVTSVLTTDATGHKISEATHDPGSRRFTVKYGDLSATTDVPDAFPATVPWIAHQAAQLTASVASRTEKSLEGRVELRWRRGDLLLPQQSKAAPQWGLPIQALSDYAGRYRVVARWHDRTDIRGSKVLRDAQPSDAPSTYRATATAELYDQDNEFLGMVRWFAEPRVLTWAFLDGNHGWFDDQRVPGGIPFEPSLRWIQVQAFSNVHFYGGESDTSTLGTSQEDASSLSKPSAGTCGPALSEGRLAEEISKHHDCDGQSNGCNLPGKSWVDGSIFRTCCDSHDYCYEVAYDQGSCCSGKSWWFLQGWHCQRCNFSVVACFLTASLWDPNSPYQDLDGDGYVDPPEPTDFAGGLCGNDPVCWQNLEAHWNNSCQQSGGSWCPAYCSSCTSNNGWPPAL